jgi:hypothetical protein
MCLGSDPKYFSLGIAKKTGVGGPLHVRRMPRASVLWPASAPGTSKLSSPQLPPAQIAGCTSAGRRFLWLVHSRRDCFQGNLNETGATAVADTMVRTGMAAAGFDVLTIDEFWYKNNCAVNSSCLDANGRPQPDEAKWPSSAGGKGFKPFADKMHALGLKVGIHTLRGSVSSEAIAKKAPILGRYMQLRRVV